MDLRLISFRWSAWSIRGNPQEYGFADWRALKARVSEGGRDVTFVDDDKIGPCSPFFIVSAIQASIEYYTGKLGFECRYKGPEEGAFFAILGRGSAQIMIKEIRNDVAARPNHKVHAWARWDAFIYTAHPKQLADEFVQRGVTFHKPLEQDPEDGLIGFEVADPDGYVCFFGHPN